VELELELGKSVDALAVGSLGSVYINSLGAVAVQ
jgi:hypothetical protein